VTATFDSTTTVNTNLFRPYLGIDRWNLPEWGGTANYNALQVKAERRMSKSLTFTMAYTFSKALGTADSVFNASAIPGEVRQANYGRLSYDRTNILVFSYSYWLPKPVHGTTPFNNPVTRLLINSWQISGITTFRSGAPSQVGFNISGVNNNQYFTGNPDYGPRLQLTGNPLSNNRSLMQWINTDSSVYALPPVGSYGNDSGIGYLTLPGTKNTDLTVMKNVPFAKDSRRYVQLRIEAYNVFGRVPWNGINSTLTFASKTSNQIVNLPLGIATGTANGGRFGFGSKNGLANIANNVSGFNRVVQVAAKVYF
jgi:hypothetical protein